MALLSSLEVLAGFACSDGASPPHMAGRERTAKRVNDLSNVVPLEGVLLPATRQIQLCERAAILQATVQRPGVTLKVGRWLWGRRCSLVRNSLSG